MGRSNDMADNEISKNTEDYVKAQIDASKKTFIKKIYKNISLLAAIMTLLTGFGGYGLFKIFVEEVVEDTLKGQAVEKLIENIKSDGKKLKLIVQHANNDLLKIRERLEAVEKSKSLKSIKDKIKELNVEITHINKKIQKYDQEMQAILQKTQKYDREMQGLKKLKYRVSRFIKDTKKVKPALIGIGKATQDGFSLVRHNKQENLSVTESLIKNQIKILEK
jgi:DNA repair ATPase RecN